MDLVARAVSRAGQAVELTAKDAASTVVKVKGDGQVGGTLAGVGQRMLPGIAKMLMNDMFGCVKKQIEGAG